MASSYRDITTINSKGGKILKNSAIICIYKVYANKNVHTLIFNAKNFVIMGICKKGERVNFIENTSKEQKLHIQDFLYENCIKTDSKFHKRITGRISIKLINAFGVEKVLILKGITIIGIYQNKGVDFIEHLQINVKKEAIKELYQFGYISVDTYGKIFNKLESA